MTAAPPRRRFAAVVPAAPRLAARAQAERQARRGRIGRRVARALAVLLVLAAGAWMLLASSWLAVDRVTVSGVSRLSADEVRAAVALRPGLPLARVDTAGVRRAVGRLPEVAGVQVRRSWPGTVHVVVTERVPVAGVQRAGAVTLVDAAGVPFATEARLPRGLVRLDVSSPGPGDAATGAALAVHRELPARLRARVVTVRASSPAAVELVLRGGKRVVWGRPGGTASKAAATEALLRMPGKLYDVSAPGVVVRR